MEKKYSRGLNAYSANPVVTCLNMESAIKKAMSEGFGFVREHNADGTSAILAWNAMLLSRDEALERYCNDADKREEINRSSHNTWIISPVEGASDIVLPFDGRIITKFVVISISSI